MLSNPSNNKTAEVEKAKQQLLLDLETKGMRFLLDQMKNNDLYSPLILEVRRKSVAFNSDDTVSWHAFRRSDDLSSAEDKNELLQLLSDPAYSGRQKDIYRCLACLCSNAQDIGLFEFLMQVVDKEEDDNIIVSILSRLRNLKKPFGVNLAPIKRQLAEGTFESRISAAKALSNTEDPEVETLLLEEFKMSDKDTQSMFCSTLETIGTSQSLPVLKAALRKTRDQFFRSGLETAIYCIEKRENARAGI
jgi:hypothetical protein